MEIGQVMFGAVQSWARFEVPRYWDVQGLLNGVLDSLAEKGQLPYDDGEFHLREYNYDAHCTCGLEDLLKRTIWQVDHREDCQRQVALKRYRKASLDERRGLFEEYKNSKCTCDFGERYRKQFNEFIKAWGGEPEHKPDCEADLPNFWHRPSNLKLMWYKYPLRSAYSNREVLHEELLSLVIRLAFKVQYLDTSIVRDLL